MAELYYQQWQSGQQYESSDSNRLNELEVDEDFITLSKEVASYYKPLVETLVQAGILTVNIIPSTRGCAVFEVDSVLDERISYFNEGKIMLVVTEEQVNGKGGKLKAEFKKRLRKFVQFVSHEAE